MIRLSRLSVITGLALASTAGASIAADLVLSDSAPEVTEKGGYASAFLSAGFGYLWTDRAFIADETEASAIELAASAVYQFTPEFGVQGDLVYTNLDSDDFAVSNIANFDGALHLFYRDSSSFLIGGIVQLGKSDIDYTWGATEDFTRSYVGVEGQLYLDVLTLYGQLGWQGVEYEFNDDSGVFANIEARYFVTDDLRLDVHAGISTYEEQDLATYNLGIGAEYKVADLSFSFFGKLDYYSIESSDQPLLEAESVRATVGLKLNLGDDTLFDRDREGPTLKPVEASIVYPTPIP